MEALELAKLMHNTQFELHREGVLTSEFGFMSLDWDHAHMKYQGKLMAIAEELLKHVSASDLSEETSHSVLDTKSVDSLFDQAKVMDVIAGLANHVQRLETEVFSTGISNGERSRQTLLGRVNELSEASDLPHVDQSWFPF